MLDTDLAWLAGIMDGEGTITFAVIMRGARLPNRGWKPHARITLMISFPSCSPEILEKVRRILDEMGVKHSSLSKATQARNARRPNLPYAANSRLIDRVNIVSRPGGIVLMRSVLPYLTLKASVARVALRYCERRAALPYSGADTAYGAAEITDLNEIRHLNFRGDRDQYVGVAELTSLDPISWRGRDGVIFRDYRAAQRSLHRNHVAIIPAAVDANNFGEASGAGDEIANADL